MADDKLKIVATVEDQFTGPLSKLQKGLKQVGDETAKHGATWKKDWGAAREEISKVRGVLGGFEPILSKIGIGGFGAALSVAGVVTALKGFSGSTRDLSQMARQIGLTANELRTLSELGGKAGVSAETMKGAINQFAGNMVDLRQRWGQAYGELKNMNLGKLAEELVNAPNMEAAIERAMEGLRGVPDPQKRARVSMLLFGTPDIGIVASSLNGPIRDAVAKLQAELGTLDKSTLEAAERFEQNLNRMHNRWENLKLKTLGPLLEGADKVLEGAEQERKAAPSRERQDQIRRQLDVLDESIARKRMNGDETGAAQSQKKRDALAAEMQRLTDEIRRLREQGGGASVSPSSFNGSTSGGGSLIQKAAWGGFGSSGGGSAIPAYGSPGGSGGGGTGGGAGGASGAPSGPDLGDGIRGRPFGSKGAIGGTKGAVRGPAGIPYQAGELKGAVGIDDAQYDAFREGVTDLEGKRYDQVGGYHGRYTGRYQFGPNEMRETARQLGEAPPTRAQFLGDKAMQERFMERYTLEHHKYLMRHSPEYRALSPEDRLGILGYAHNQGAGGAAKYLRTGRAGRDGFGTSGAAYPRAVKRRLDGVRTARRPGETAGSPGGGLKQIKPWTRAPAIPSPVSRVDMDDDGGMYGGTGALKGTDDEFEAWLKRMHEEEAKNPVSPEQLEQQRRGYDRNAFVDAMKERAGRGTKFGSAESEAVNDPSRTSRDALNRMLGRGRESMKSWTGEHENDDALRRSKLQGRSSDPSYRPDRDLTLDEIRKFRGPDRKVGDALMDRFYGKGAAGGGPAMQMPGGSGAGGKGSLHIKVDGPPGTQVKADMSDLFGDTKVSHGKSQMNL